MSSSIGSSSTSSTFRSPFGFIDRFLSPLRRAIYNAPKCPLPIDLPPPNGTPRFPNNDFSEELARFEKAAKHLLPLLKQLDRPPAHIAALGPDVAAMVSFNEAVAFSRAPQPADLDPLHHHHIHRIEHHITHLLSHLRHETSNLIANANLQNACKCHAETEALEKRLRNLQDEVSR
ncbi:hypothetical protein EX30DRAFT_160732 [Ascodesmis nigricans]|uniref:Uncharacterized protein n=1 Tax=Ascodesmis nigricans TaxID=341454 RepID=A0A4S2MMS2_9PEZI|nr:hypothetical protein EX30DRAFT_160732 [Ascodesmis nigricans]